jgi:DNA-binding response OmpR family regulator
MKDVIVLICDNDEQVLGELKEELARNDYRVRTLTDATAVVSQASAEPTILVINPDIKGFNEYDVCKKLKQERGVPVIFLQDRNSTHRTGYGDCEADDVVSKPVEIDLLLNQLEKHYTVTVNTKK